MRSRQPTKLKIVLDTSVLVAALLSRSGGSAQILEFLFGGTFYNFYTSETIDELSQVLMRPKFNLKNELCARFVHLLTEASFPVEPLIEFKVMKCRDPKDDKFLSLARQVEADYLVSLDTDLLDIKQEGAVAIITPSDFLLRARNRTHTYCGRPQ